MLSRSPRSLRARPAGASLRVSAASPPARVTMALGATGSTSQIARSQSAAEGVGARQLENLAHHGVIAISHTAERTEGGHVEPAVDQRIIPDVHADDLAENNKVMVSLDLNDLRHAAFKSGRSICHAGTIDFGTWGLRYACVGELIHIGRKCRR